MILVNSRQHKFSRKPNPLEATSIFINPYLHSDVPSYLIFEARFANTFVGTLLPFLNSGNKYSQIQIYTFTHSKFLLHNLGPSTIPCFSVFFQLFFYRAKRFKCGENRLCLFVYFFVIDIFYIFIFFSFWPKKKPKNPLNIFSHFLLVFFLCCICLFSGYFRYKIFPRVCQALIKWEACKRLGWKVEMSCGFYFKWIRKDIFSRY